MNDQYADPLDRATVPPPLRPPPTVDDVLEAARAAHAATHAPVWDTSESDFRELAKAGLIVALVERYQRAVAAAKSALAFAPNVSTARELCLKAVAEAGQPLECDPPSPRESFTTAKPRPKPPPAPPPKPDLFSNVEEAT